MTKLEKPNFIKLLGVKFSGSWKLGTPPSLIRLC